MKYTGLLVIVSLLFASCASVYYYRDAGMGKTEGVRAFVEKHPKLIDKPNHFGSTTLIIAVQKKKYETAQALITLGANVDYEHKNSQTPLRIAIGNEDIEMVKLLIDAGANVNKANSHGWMPLMSAATRGYLPIVKLLVASGADVYAKTKKEFTASALALQENHTNVYEYLSSLMDKKASANKENFRTATEN